jgi:phage-related protein
MNEEWTIRVSVEVRDWLSGLTPHHQARAARAINLLREYGAQLGEPHTRRLRGKLRELRFYVDQRATRITYFSATERQMILLTVFVKTQRQERREIERAHRAMLGHPQYAPGERDIHG